MNKSCGHIRTINPIWHFVVAILNILRTVSISSDVHINVIFHNITVKKEIILKRADIQWIIFLILLTSKLTSIYLSP